MRTSVHKGIFADNKRQLRITVIVGILSSNDLRKKQAVSARGTSVRSPGRKQARGWRIPLLCLYSLKRTCSSLRFLKRYERHSGACSMAQLELQLFNMTCLRRIAQDRLIAVPPSPSMAGSAARPSPPSEGASAARRPEAADILI